MVKKKHTAHHQQQLTTTTLMLRVKFSLNRSNGCGKDNPLIFVVSYYLPLETIRNVLLNELESPLPKDALCQVGLKIGPLQWFW